MSVCGLNLLILPGNKDCLTQAPNYHQDDVDVITSHTPRNSHTSNGRQGAHNLLQAHLRPAHDPCVMPNPGVECAAHVDTLRAENRAFGRLDIIPSARKEEGRGGCADGFMQLELV